MKEHAYSYNCTRRQVWQMKRAPERRRGQWFLPLRDTYVSILFFLIVDLSPHQKFPGPQQVCISERRSCSTTRLAYTRLRSVHPYRVLTFGRESQLVMSCKQIPGFKGVPGYPYGLPLPCRTMAQATRGLHSQYAYWHGRCTVDGGSGRAVYQEIAYECTAC